MNFVIVFLSITACINTVYCAVAILPPQEKPDDLAQQEGCYVPTLAKVLHYQEKYSSQNGTECKQYHCKEDNYVTIYTCGAIAAGENCVIVPGDKFLPYPECCNQLTCNQNKSIGNATDTIEDDLDESESDKKEVCIEAEPSTCADATEHSAPEDE